MKLWAGGKSGGAGSAVRATVKSQVTEINRKAVSRGVRAVNALRNAELEVLKGKRNGEAGRRKPYSKATYTASAPGEPPARRTGNLRLHWSGQVKTTGSTHGGIRLLAELESNEKYAGFLENGTSKMAARPFVEKIKEKAEPEISRIYGEPWT